MKADRDFIDDALMVGSAFDWITPAWAFIQDMINGSSYQINIPDDIGYSATDISDLLNKHGIKVWGLMIVGHTITFTVTDDDAEEALELLGEWF